jgi:hypothetical protein
MMLSDGAGIATGPLDAMTAVPLSVSSIGRGVGTGTCRPPRAAAAPALAERIKMAASEIAQARRAQSR